MTSLSNFGELRMSTPVSRAGDDARREERRKATLTVAHRYATDAQDCRELLAMLGLDPADGRQPQRGNA